jgi:hypothetical protein
MPRSMGWNSLGTQFCLELGFGVLLALAFVPRAPVGALFYRVCGTTALVPLLVACTVPPLTGLSPWTDPVVLCTAISVLAYPVYSGPVRGASWGAGLGVALASSGAAIALLLHQAELTGGAGARALAALSALATGTVAGSVGIAMVLGHWYLTVPNLQVKHLSRLNRVTAVSMGLSLGLVLLTLVAFREAFESAELSLFGPTGMFYLGTRITVGLVAPLGFAAMTASSLRYGNTRSATGILYASTVLVLIGTAVSVSLQDSYGIPL